MAWALGTTGITVIPASMAGATTVAHGTATGIMMAGATTASATAAGIMTVFEAADSPMKALGAAASVVAASFMVAVNSTEIAEASMAARDFMAVATTELAMDIAK